MDLGQRAGMADHAGAGDFRDDIGGAPDRGDIAQDGSKALHAINPVLQRDHAGVRANERPRLLARRLRIPKLYGEEYDVDGADLLGVTGDIDLLEMKLAERALYLEPLAAHGVDTYAPDTRIKEHPVKIGQGEWTAVYGIMEGTFTKPMTTADGKVIQPNGKSFKLIAFRAADTPLGLAILSSPADARWWLAGSIKRDEWNGGNAAEMHLDDAARA